MNNFNDIKAEWDKCQVPFESKTGYKEIINKSKEIKKKQHIGQIVLGITIAILLFFFFYVSAYKNTQAFWGLGIMIGSLALRMIMEYYSMQKLNNIPSHKNMKQYNHSLINYYRTRKYIHFLITPFLFGIYILGFIMLLPSFKNSLSAGFYTYILVSSVLVFAAPALLIITQIKKELNILKRLH